MDETTASFESLKERLECIASKVDDKNISLDEALSLYEEAVQLGLRACDLSESDLKLDTENSQTEVAITETSSNDGASSMTAAVEVGAPHSASVEAPKEEQSIAYQ